MKISEIMYPILKSILILYQIPKHKGNPNLVKQKSFTFFLIIAKMTIIEKSPKKK